MYRVEDAITEVVAVSSHLEALAGLGVGGEAAVAVDVDPDFRLRGGETLGVAVDGCEGSAVAAVRVALGVAQCGTGRSAVAGNGIDGAVTLALEHAAVLHVPAGLQVVVAGVAGGLRPGLGRVEATADHVAHVLGGDAVVAHAVAVIAGAGAVGDPVPAGEVVVAERVVAGDEDHRYLVLAHAFVAGFARVPEAVAVLVHDEVGAVARGEIGLAVTREGAAFDDGDQVLNLGVDLLAGIAQRLYPPAVEVAIPVTEAAAAVVAARVVLPHHVVDDVRVLPGSLHGPLDRHLVQVTLGVAVDYGSAIGPGVVPDHVAAIEAVAAEVVEVAPEVEVQDNVVLVCRAGELLEVLPVAVILQGAQQLAVGGANPVGVEGGEERVAVLGGLFDP